MRSRLILAVAGLLGAVSLAPAQQFAPKPIEPTSITTVAPAPLPATINPIVAASARTVSHGPVVAHGEGCAAPSVSLHKAHARNRSSVLGNLFIGSGTVNPVGCGCLASERTFAFGSCRQFYNPGGECHGGCSGCWPVDRRPPGYGVTSYLNR